MSETQLNILLKRTARLVPEPELPFQPSADADYDTSAKVLEAIKASRVTKLGFVGNEAYSSTESPSN